MALATSIAVLLNAAATLYAKATRPRTAPTIIVAPPEHKTADRIRPDLDALVAAYPDHLTGHDDHFLIWRNGMRTPLGERSARRTAAEILAKPTIIDLFAWPYPLGHAPAEPQGDPGRARPEALFTGMYGDCAKGEVQRELVDVRWVDGHTLRFTKVNGAASALEAVARDLERLGPDVAKYLWPTSGTFNCRPIAGTTSPSMHGYGAAIDLASRYGAYWRWGPKPDTSRSIPTSIVSVFEKHGFIWGGKWAHFDSFHFEYRPEIIRAAKTIR